MKILVPLLDPNAEHRKAPAERLGGRLFRLLDAPGDDQWAFPPGCVVAGERIFLPDGSKAILARAA